MTKRENNWMDNYCLLKDYVKEHHHLPDKKKMEYRRLLNWWKYNRKVFKAGRMDKDRAKMLEELSNMRDGVEKGFCDDGL